MMYIYLLDSLLHDEADCGDWLHLADPVDPRQRLLFQRRIPLRLH